jgi:hypothetical protein
VRSEERIPLGHLLIAKTFRLLQKLENVADIQKAMKGLVYILVNRTME